MSSFYKCMITETHASMSKQSMHLGLIVLGLSKITAIKVMTRNNVMVLQIV